MISTKELGARITTWRKRRKLTQAELAAGIGIARTTLVAVENGHRRPSNRELLALANALDVQVHELLKEHAVPGGVAPRFRLPSRPGVDKRVLEEAVETTRALGARYWELERLLGLQRVPAPLESIATYRVPGPGRWGDPLKAAEHAAHSARSTMDLGDTPVFELEALLDVHAGLRIFHPELDARIAAVYLWGDELGGCISVNRRQPGELRRWRIAHALAHFLRDRERGEILFSDERPRRDAPEAFADRFAVEFLLPAPGVRKYFSDVSRASRFTVADVLQMAHFFGVTFDAVLVRLEELDLVPGGRESSVAPGGFRVCEGEARLSPETNAPTPDLLPERCRLLALTAYHEALISETELAEFLQCDRVEARAAFDAKRTQGALQLDLAFDLLGRRKQ